MRPTRHRNGGRPVPRDGSRVAIIQSGGGAKGAYGLGVMRAILAGASPSTRHQPCNPEIYTGTSVGAYNAAIMASQPGTPPLRTLDALIQIWRQRIANTPGGCGNGVFRLRGIPLQELEPACFLDPVSSFVRFSLDWVYLAQQGMIRAARFASSDLPLPGRLLDIPDISAFFDPAPLRELIWSTVDLDSLGRSTKNLAVATSDWQNGLTRVFWKREIVEHREIDAILASTAIPGIFPTIDIHGVPYVDGALTMNTPLKPAIQAGADILHVIYLDPLIAVAEPARYASTFETMARVYAILAAAQVRNDIEDAESVNRGLAILAGARQQVQGDSGDLLSALDDLEGIIRRIDAQPRRTLIIHRYVPQGQLASGSQLLDFALDHIDSLIEQGYRDAVHHDCKTAGCVLPESAGRGESLRSDPRDRRIRRAARERIGIL